MEPQNVLEKKDGQREKEAGSVNKMATAFPCKFLYKVCNY